MFGPDGQLDLSPVLGVMVLVVWLCARLACHAGDGRVWPGMFVVTVERLVDLPRDAVLRFGG